jgi:hypothetical protein
MRCLQVRIFGYIQINSLIIPFLHKKISFSKIYYSENAYTNHLQSNKHKAAEAKAALEGMPLI